MIKIAGRVQDKLEGHPSILSKLVIVWCRIKKSIAQMPANKLLFDCCRLLAVLPAIGNAIRAIPINVIGRLNFFHNSERNKF